MAELSFEYLIQRHEMGQAYKAITTLMGPNPQLIAFVNFNKVTADNVGLESFDIIGQHNQILKQIQSDPSLEMACEGFIGKLLGIKNKNDKKLELNSSSKKLDVHKLEFYYILMIQFHEHFTFEQEVLQKIPSDYKESSWKAFDEYVEKRRAKVRKTLDSIKYEKGIDDKVPIDQSGWTKEKHHVEHGILAKAIQEHAVYFSKPFATETEVLKNWINSKGDDNKAVVKYMHSSIGSTPMGFSIHDLMPALDIINSLSPYFDSK